MSILTLTPSTIRLIGSTQVLTDPTSVIKELLENSLDGGANSIFIETSINTLDLIQVRDNGQGISPDDRDIACRRYCTSKIRDYSDLKNVGGKWLGFRGEALSSAAELSGTFTLTTRVEGEDVAVALKIKTNGEVDRRDLASHPVGTTVRLTDLFNSLPVRKQSALKQSAKSLVKTKRMLQSYALARPFVRFSLRILKAKNDKGNWTFAPKVGGAMEDAAFKVVGKECASQCEWMVVERNGFEVRAFLPSTEADNSKISNIGHFVSIDSRPVSTIRGTLKQMMTMFKEKLRNSNQKLASAKDVFIWLNIACPPQSYDPNIEPAKDDVMFEDKDKFLEAVEALFDQCYPAIAPYNSLAARDNEIEIFEDSIENETDRPAKRQCLGYSTLCQYDEDEGEIGDILSAVVDEDGEAEEEEDAGSSSGLRDPHISNPWVMAKMNTSVRPRKMGSTRNGQLLTPLQERNNSSINSKFGAKPPNFPPHPPWNLPSPQNSSPLHDAASSKPMQSSTDGFNCSSSASPRTEPRRNGPFGSIQNSMIDEGQLMSTRQTTASRHTGWNAINDFVSAGQLPIDNTSEAPLQSSPWQNRPTRRQQYLRSTDITPADVQKPFVSYAHDAGNVWFDHLSSVAGPQKRSAGGRRRGGQQQDLDIRDVFASIAESPETGLEEFGSRGRQNGLDVVRNHWDGDEDDFDVDINAARPQRHLRLDEESQTSCLRSSIYPTISVSSEPPSHPPDISNPPPPKSPTKNIAAQESSTFPSPSTKLPNPVRKLSRHTSRTARLPLERIPPGYEIHNLISTVSTSIRVLTDLADELHILEHECGDILAPVWKAAHGGYGRGHSENGSGIGYVDIDADGDDDVTEIEEDEEREVQQDDRRGSLTHPPPTRQQIAAWHARLHKLAMDKGLSCTTTADRTVSEYEVIAQS